MRLLVCALLSLGVCVGSAAVTPAPASACDDGVPLPEGVECAPIPSDEGVACPGEGHMLALMHGCYHCVDGATCLLSSALPLGAEQPDKSQGSAAAPPTSTPIQTPIQSALAAHKVAGSAVAKDTASKMVRSTDGQTAGLAVASQDDQASASGWTSHLSSGAFVVPVAALALVGVGVAAHKLSASVGDQKFERLQEEAAADEINPFCASALAHDSDDAELELAEDEEHKDDASSAGDEEQGGGDGPEVVVARSILDDSDEDEPCL